MIYECICRYVPPKKKNVNSVFRKTEKMKAKNDHDTQKGAELKFCTQQYLYISE